MAKDTVPTDPKEPCIITNFELNRLRNATHFVELSHLLCRAETQFAEGRKRQNEDDDDETGR